MTMIKNIQILYRYFQLAPLLSFFVLRLHKEWLKRKQPDHHLNVTELTTGMTLNPFSILFLRNLTYSQAGLDVPGSPGPWRESMMPLHCCSTHFVRSPLAFILNLKVSKLLYFPTCLYPWASVKFLAVPGALPRMDDDATLLFSTFCKIGLDSI